MTQVHDHGLPAEYLEEQFRIIESAVLKVESRGDPRLRTQVELALAEISRSVLDARQIADQVLAISFIVAGQRPRMGEPADTVMSVAAVEDLRRAVDAAGPSKSGDVFGQGWE